MTATEVKDENAIGNKTSWLGVAILTGLLALPLFAHGCHGDDIDHEPTVAPPTERFP